MCKVQIIPFFGDPKFLNFTIEECNTFSKTNNMAKTEKFLHLYERTLLKKYYLNTKILKLF